MTSKPNSVKAFIKRRILWLMAFCLVFILLLNETEPLFSLLLMLYGVVTFFLLSRWIFKQIKSIIKLKNEKTKNELLHLQSQVNPHFFFNTLNNLYGLIEKDSKKAQDLVLKLSDMMRYSIYDGQKDLVPLTDELQYLQNYIELHKARYYKKTEVSFSQHVQNSDLNIMPLLFIILVENAFKHGVENLRENAYVHINIIAGEQEVNFAVENNFDLEESKEENGIGLKNLERRLELVYPNRHTFTHTVQNDVYKVQLTLKTV